MTVAYREVGTYRGAAAMCGCDPKTIKRALARLAGRRWAGRAQGAGPATTTWSSMWSAARVAKTAGRISAKRLLPEARRRRVCGFGPQLPAAGGQGQVGLASRAITGAGARRCGRRATRWSSTGARRARCTCSARCWPGAGGGSCASPPMSGRRRRLAMLAECFEALGGVPKVVLADRMGCLKGGVVANVVVPTPDYVRFATHYRFRPDFCEGGDPESKGIVENLVGYAKSDLVVPAEPDVERPRRRRTRRPGLVR